MSYVDNSAKNLLEYVIAYLEEETNRPFPTDFNNEDFLYELVDNAVDAYKEGAR